MRPLLIDEGLPGQVAAAFRCLGLDALAVGEDGAPPRKSDDDVNIAWCENRGAVLVTNDRGKKDRTIFDRLAEHHVNAIFVYDDLRSADPHRLALALLKAEPEIERLMSRRHGLIRHRLGTTGRLEKR